MCWRLVDAGWATLEELETHWSLDDALAANEVLDALLEARSEKPGND